MARSLSRILSLTRLTPISTATPKATVRRRSGPPERHSEVEKRAEEERRAVRKLEEAVHRMIVKKSEPNWLPLVPGGSYWVPPTYKSRGFSEVIGRLTEPGKKVKDLSLSSSRGWPSSAHFFKGASQSPLEGETTSKYSSKSEDEEQ